MPRSIAGQTVEELGGPESVLARRAPDRLAPLAGAAGGGLAKLAALVERTHPARLGDRPPTSR